MLGTPDAAFVVLAGLTSAEVVRQGAFYRADAFVVAVAAAGLIVASLRQGADQQVRRTTVALGACATWWLVAGVLHGRAVAFLPLGASMLGFLAAFLVVQPLDAAQRHGAALVASTIGAGAGALGLAASAMRWYPIAIPSQSLWRLATTLTYSDAAGLLLGMGLLLGVGLDPHRALVRLDVALCTAGLIATQSRGAALALLAGGLFVPFGAIRAARWPLVGGLASGLLVVATSSGPTQQPAVVAGVVALVAAGTLLRPPGRRLVGGPSGRRAVIVVGILAAVALAAVVALHTPIQRRVQLASTTDRVSEWHAGLDQWRSSIWVGVGPDVALRFGPRDVYHAYFAHDEYLQVGADAGLVGELLLVLAAGSIVVAVRRSDTLSSCAIGALVAFGVAAAFDFDWHLAALGLVGGWAAGLACPPRLAES